MTRIPSDETVSQQILGIFFKNSIRADGALRRNQFLEVRDGDFQRGINCAVEQGWITFDKRDRYKYHLTEAGYLRSQKALAEVAK